MQACKDRLYKSEKNLCLCKHVKTDYINQKKKTLFMQACKDRLYKK